MLLLNVLPRISMKAKWRSEKKNRILNLKKTKKVHVDVSANTEKHPQESVDLLAAFHGFKARVATEKPKNKNHKNWFL